MSGSVLSDQRPQLIDLLHLGRERVIGSWLVGDVVIDPGPEACLATLLDALGDRKPTALALTHIHLDHAGAAGSLCERYPELEVWVHERGAAHLVDPSKLLASAGRLYGQDMARLWGEVLPVPADRLRVLVGGERIAGFDVLYTPGHASHHVSYVHGQTGWAFTGDVTGVRVSPDGPVLPATPPPDVDLQAWERSLATIGSLDPSAVVPTHFGAHTDVEAHLSQMRDRLSEYADRASSMSEQEFSAAMSADLRVTVDPGLLPAYLQAMPPYQSYQGLLRYHSKRAAAEQSRS